MPAPSPLHVSRLLALTAVVNIVGGLVNLLLPGVHGQLVLGPEVVIEGTMLRYHVMFWGFVVVMGLGYAMAARDPERHTALVLCGGLGKLLAVVVWTEMLVNGLGQAIMLPVIVFDGVLGGLFLAFVVPRLRH